MLRTSRNVLSMGAFQREVLFVAVTDRTHLKEFFLDVSDLFMTLGQCKVCLYNDFFVLMFGLTEEGTTHFITKVTSFTKT